MTPSTRKSVGASIRYGSTRSRPEPRSGRPAAPGVTAVVNDRSGRRSVVALRRQEVLDLGRGLVERRPSAAAGCEGDVELRADDRLDLGPVGGPRPGLRAGVELGEGNGQEAVVLDGLRIAEGRGLDGQVARPGQRGLDVIA